MFLTKSDYIHLFLHCPLHLWVAKHRPEEWGFKVDPALHWKMEEGNRVETIARRLFPGGQLVGGHDRRTAAATSELIEQGATLLFQATAQAPRLFAMADVFHFDPETERWNIIEVKASTEVKGIHLHDLCFQRRAFQEAGFPIGRLSLGLVNNNFVRTGELDPSAFIRIVDVSAAANDAQSEVDARIDEAISILDRADLPTRQLLGCTCAPSTCDCCHVCFPDLPKRPVFSLPRIKKDRAHELYDQGIRSVDDLPAGMRLTESQELIAKVIKTGTPFIDREGIHERLRGLHYPLYFLDYESFASAVPLFDGYRPYQQMVFQYSLHVLPAPDAEPLHRSFLSESLDDPAPPLTTQLRCDIGEEGTVVVWNKSFEMSRNREMADIFPDQAEFLRSLNGRVFDLMEVFRDQLYVHPEIGGSCSIKDVLPVLVPEQSYADLDVRDGSSASIAWFRMISIGNGNADVAKIRGDLLAYCRLDTLAMVEIFRHLLVV